MHTLHICLSIHLSYYQSTHPSIYLNYYCLWTHKEKIHKIRYMHTCVKYGKKVLYYRNKYFHNIFLWVIIIFCIRCIIISMHVKQTHNFIILLHFYYLFMYILSGRVDRDHDIAQWSLAPKVLSSNPAFPTKHDMPSWWLSNEAMTF
jgi:hypothetical protein